jgi:hypothetical protein
MGSCETSHSMEGREFLEWLSYISQQGLLCPLKLVQEEHQPQLRVHNMYTRYFWVPPDKYVLCYQ